MTIIQNYFKNTLDTITSEELNKNLTNYSPVVVTNKTNPTLTVLPTDIEDLLEIDQMSQEVLSKLITRLESVATRLENQAVTGQQSKNFWFEIFKSFFVVVWKTNLK